MADSNKYYVLRGDKVLEESMTKEQILSAITQAVEGHEIHDVDTGFVEKIKEQKSGANLKFWVGSTAEYNAIQTKDTNCFYILTDDTQFEDLESDVASLQAAVAQLQSGFASLTEPNTVLYGNVGDMPVSTNDSFYIPIDIPIGNYNLFAVVIADTMFLDTATDIKTLLIYCYDHEIIEDDHIVLLRDNKVNRIEASPELANSLRAVSYDVEVFIEGTTQTQRELSLICDRYFLNLTSNASTSTNYYLHKLIAVI